ncbi:nodulation efficiency protein D [Sulfurimonas sp.]|uniref:NfeD family protein n=1 Tax=Sulfurimonas sp. TaxID=2022749 RepID=UPI0025ECDD7D|nr:nodulation efficiency protein D [Sulfurimonas sp.]MBT5934655.1 nodulation efficiency protein D [Sulfurimonas sp.]
MESLTLSLISPTILIAIGIGLIAMEALVFTFVFFWFGLAFLTVGVLSYFPLFTDGLWQLSTIAILAILSLILLRAKATDLFLNSQAEKNNDNFLNEKGIGVIKNGKVYYKATYWNIDPTNKESFNEGESVNVLSALKGVVAIEKIISENL